MKAHSSKGKNNRVSRGWPAILFVLSIFLSSHTVSEEINPDPWERWNRGVFTFNEYLDRYLLKPVAIGYKTVVPKPVDRGVSNAFRNIGEVRTVVNDMFQLKFTQAASDTGRIVVNSTIGIGGLFDVAGHWGLERHREDFGQTLGYWNVAPGPYLVLPFFGPSTLRDSFGLGTDSFLANALEYDFVQEIDHVETRNQVIALNIIDTRAGLLAAEELIQGDKYSFIRDVYLQQRQYQVRDGVMEDPFLDDDEELIDDEW